jgi:predicted GNAT superfamily acetyltransferase
VIEKIEGRSIATDIRSLPVLVAVCETGAPMIRDLKAALRSDQFVIEIPRDIGAIEGSDPEIAANWRKATREAFTTALEAGYVVDDFVRAGPQVGAYVLSKRSTPSSW